MSEFSSWFEAVAERAGRAPARVALRDGEVALDYAEVVRRASALAAWLYDRGVRPGDRVGVHLRKSVEEVLLTLALVRLGAVFVHVHPQLTLVQLRHVVADSGMRLLVTQARRASELLEQAGGARPTLLVVEADAPPGALPWPSLEGQAEPPVPPPAPSALGALLYTSGSTGRPKGVMHSQGNLLAFATSVARYLRLTPDDRVLGLLPISFGYGLSQLLSTWLAGGTLVLQKAPFPAEVVKAIVRERISGLAAVPSVWAQIIAYLEQEPTELDSLRYVTNAGGHLPESRARRLRELLPSADIVLMYGSTETLRSTYLPPELFASKLGSIGRAIPNVDVFVVDGEGRPCDIGQPGELVHRGAHISQGYWNNPEETASRFRPAPGLREQIGDEVVYFSGDLVRRDADGILWFLSRIGWMVKSGGFRFSLSEVEALTLESGLVQEAVAISVDDDMLGQVVHVAVSARPGESIDPAALERHSWKSMPSYMMPKGFHVWEGALPLLANGKVDRQRVREELCERLARA